MSENIAQPFYAYIQDGKIFAHDYAAPQQVGVTSKEADRLRSRIAELEETAAQYYERLVDIGEIVPEPTLEEIIKKQADQLSANAELMAKLLSRLEKMEGKPDGLVKPVEQNSGPEPETNRGRPHGVESHAELSGQSRRTPEGHEGSPNWKKPTGADASTSK